MADVIDKTSNPSGEDDHVRPNQGANGPGLVEVVGLGILFAIVIAAVFVTVSTNPIEKLYHVSRSGISGGAGRVLVYLNFPAAIAAVAILGVVVQQGRMVTFHDSWFTLKKFSYCCAGAALLCLVLALPDVVEQRDLDAKFVNVFPAAGVLLTAVLIGVVVRRGGIGRWVPSMSGDRVRIVVTALLTLISLPWIFAVFGIYIDEVPGLGRIFLSSELWPSGSTEAAVHLGDHLGTDGLLFALTALWLSRTLPRSRPSRLRSVLSAYLALLFTYGLGNIANDGWLEQIVKRGWTDWEIPSMATPELSLMWGIALAGAVLAEIYWLRPQRRQTSDIG